MQAPLTVEVASRLNGVLAEPEEGCISFVVPTLANQPTRRFRAEIYLSHDDKSRHASLGEVSKKEKSTTS